MKRAHFLASLLAISSLSLGGCAATVEPESSSEVASEEALTSGDKAIVAEFKKAVQGIESGGGEGDPQQWEVITVSLRKGDTMKFEALTNRVAPKIPNLSDPSRDESETPIYGFDLGYPMHEYWEKELAIDPEAEDMPAERARATKMKALKALCESRLTNMVNLTMGRTYEGGDSIETGEVAHTLIGKLPSGKLLVIYGIDVWT